MKKRATLNEILAKGSAGFRALNDGTRTPVRRQLREAARALVAAAPHPEPQPVHREALERDRAPAPASGLGPIERPLVHFTLFRVQLLDGDNKYASVKFLLDALRHAKLIPDDRERDIALIVDQERVPEYRLEGTGIVIEFP